MKSIIKTFIYFLKLLIIFAKTTYVRLKKGKCIFFIATPNHGNLGDHAIVYAQWQLLQDIGADDYIIELSRTEYETFKISLSKFIIKRKDLIIIDGGGNIGTLWLEEEYKMRDIITRFSQNPIYIFPQTAFFENSENGQAELKNSIRIYNSHSNLTIFCRDSDTYSLVKQNFTNVKSYYTPDTVLYLNQTCDSTRDDTCLLCFRDDKECTSNVDVKDTIITYFKDKQYPFSETTTITSENVTKTNRIKLLHDKWSEFAHARLVVTDRLHGMIFAAITGTPCLALDNVSHKVRNGYQWISHLEYILFCDNDSQIRNKLHEVDIISAKHFNYSKKQMETDFHLIKEIIKSEIFG